MLNHTVLSPPLLAALALVATPVTAMAQSTISHPSVYTARSLGELLTNTESARTNMPLVSPRQLPLTALLGRNTLPSGAFALLPGVSVGSSDGIQRNADADRGIRPEAYGNFSPQSVAPYTTARASATNLGSTPTAAAVAVTSWTSPLSVEG